MTCGSRPAPTQLLASQRLCKETPSLCSMDPCLHCCTHSRPTQLEHVSPRCLLCSQKIVFANLLLQVSGVSRLPGTAAGEEAPMPADRSPALGTAGVLSAAGV